MRAGRCWLLSASLSLASIWPAVQVWAKTQVPVAVVSLMENPNGYVGIGRGGLPDSPLPLVRVIMQQSGCFRIVDRHSGLKATVREHELKEDGILRQDDTTVRKGRGIVAQYTLVPSLTFSEQDAGRQIGGILAQIPGLNVLAGAYAPSQGSVWFQGVDVSARSAADRCRAGIARAAVHTRRRALRLHLAQ